MIEKIVEFLTTAGKFADDNQKKISTTSFKAEQVCSVVTETDLEVSRMFKAFVETNFSSLSHVIVDEETLSSLGEDKFATVSASEYQFVIDPIDGTHTYALGMPEYGISVGVMKNCRPLIGGICLPALGEILYSDGETVY